MSLPQWKGLWDWSIKYADSTGSGFRPEDVDPDKMKWLDEALKQYMVDLSARMRDIKTALQRDTTTTTTAAAAAAAAAAGGPGRGDDQQLGSETAAADLEEREALLDELMDIVSSIDYARDLHKIGGLPVLLELLASPHPSLQWRAAEVVATCVANNPPVQQWFLEGGVLPQLLQLAGPSERHPTVRTKALLALSGLVRHFGPGLQALRDAGGLSLLVGCLGDTDRRVGRKAMTLLTYLLSQRRADCAAAVAGGALPLLVAELRSSAAAAAEGADADGDADAVSSQEASDMRQAALGTLLQLASHPGTWAAVRDAPGLRPRLAELQAAHLALPADDREAQAEELGLLRQLATLLAAAAPPPAAAAARPDDQDHVSVEAFEAAGRGTTFEVNEPRPAAAVAADAGAGAGDQGGAAAAAGRGEGEGAGEQPPAPAAAPLLLGAP